MQMPLSRFDDYFKMCIAPGDTTDLDTALHLNDIRYCFPAPDILLFYI